MNTLQNMMNSITTLGGQVREQAMKVSRMAGDANVKIADLTREQKALQDMQDRLAAQQASYNALKGDAAANLQPTRNEEPRSVREMRKSNEYARAFAFALRNGLTPKTAGRFEETKILMDALSEGGGDPVGTDGGFLVPEEIDHSIRQLKREMSALAPLFNQETVTAPTGWRVFDTAPTAPMSAIDELGTVPKNDQPAFQKVTYAISKYGLRLPVSHELLSDEVANLMGYLSQWFAKKLVLTENSLLLTAMKTLTASALVTGSVTPDAAIKKILNTVLDPMISPSSLIITNQDGFDALDQLVDEMGRGLLQPDPTNVTQYKMYGRRVFVVANAQMPTDSDTHKAEFFIGDPKEFATLFSKDGYEVTSTDIGGDAWATDSTEVRGIVRMGVTKFDTAALVRRQLVIE